MWRFIRLTRSFFVLGGFLLYALGAAAAVRLGNSIDWVEYILGQVVVTAIQLMAQYLNEYYDREVDRLAPANRTWFSGGSGILPAGEISPAAVLTAARICAGFALLAGILAALVSAWMIPVMILSFLGSWFYSAPPISLMSSGWGELSTSIIVALLVPAAGYAMQAGFPPGGLWLICVPLVLVHAAMLIAFEFPDYPSDREAGKETLTVRLGKQGAARVETALIGSAYLFLTVQALWSNIPPAWAVWTFPLGIWQIAITHRLVHKSTHTGFYLLTTSGVALFGLMAFLTLLEFVFSV